MGASDEGRAGAQYVLIVYRLRMSICTALWTTVSNDV